MKKRYVFFGQLCEIEGVAALKKFGQTVDLDETFAVELMLGQSGCSIVPEDLFKSVQFDPEDLKGVRPRRSDDFVRKFDKLVVAHRAWVESLTNAVSVEGENKTGVSSDSEKK